ncbi:unnamed protein product [Phaeothamnion confervicola]
MRLSELETAALRLCLGREDDGVRAALEVFKATKDEADLADTLRRIVRITVSQAAADVAQRAAADADAGGDGEDGGSGDGGEDGEEKDDEIEVVYVGRSASAGGEGGGDDGDGDGGSSGETINMVLVTGCGCDQKGTFPAAASASETEHMNGHAAAAPAVVPAVAVATAAAALPTAAAGAENDDDDTDDPGIFLAEESRAPLFQQLLGMACEAGVLKAGQAARLSAMYDGKNVVLMAALDAYGRQKDMSELIDTLTRLVNAAE